MKLLLWIFCLSLAKCAFSAEYVPVYMWETRKTLETVPALDRISEESFKNLLLERLTKNPFVVIFEENNLSPEDFAQHDEHGAPLYPNLQALREEEKVTYWPYVRNPLLAIRQLDKKVTKVVAESFLKDPFEVPDDNILVVDLKDARDDENRVDMLKRHDRSIAGIYEYLLKRHAHVAALYTARHSSWIIPEEARGHRRYRSLLETGSDDERKIFNLPYVLLYLNSTGYYETGNTSYSLYEMATSSFLESNGTALKLTFNGSAVSLEFGFSFPNGYWQLDYLNATQGSNVYEFEVRDVYAPSNWSYHCTDGVFYGAKDAQRKVLLPGFQIQVSDTRDNISMFNDPYDCVGFTSAPIWSGLFVTFILALIMTFGLTMMMDIRTMDRFDDPKGKTITINTTE